MVIDSIELADRGFRGDSRACSVDRWKSAELELVMREVEGAESAHLASHTEGDHSTSILGRSNIVAREELWFEADDTES